MNTSTKKYYNEILEGIEKEGLYKKERIITSPQSANIEVTGGQKVLNMCANNYLGLANHPEIMKVMISGDTDYLLYDLFAGPSKFINSSNKK